VVLDDAMAIDRRQPENIRIRFIGMNILRPGQSRFKQALITDPVSAAKRAKDSRWKTSPCLLSARTLVELLGELFHCVRILAA
jgi:hypothetical protein